MTVLLARDRFVALASPTACATALDFLSIAIVRQWPGLAIGQLFAVLQPVAAILALGCFAQWCFQLTRSVVIAASVAVAFGLSPAFTAWMAPPNQVTAIGASAAIALAVTACVAATIPSGSRVVLSFVALLFAASIMPAWFAACAVFAGWLTWRMLRESPAGLRIVGTLAIGVVVGAAPFAMLRAGDVPALSRGISWYGCALAGLGEPPWSEVASTLPWTLGPVTIALAVLGLPAIWRRAGMGAVLGLAGVLALASVPAPGIPGGIMLAPFVVAVWSSAALGMLELVEMIGKGGRHLVGVTLILCLVPLLERARVQAYERDDIVSAAGHGRATLDALTSILNRVPSGAHFVEDDAGVHLLLRAALVGGRRASKPFVIIPSTRSSVVRALSEGTVYAFPRGQELLGLRGFAMRADNDVLLPGVARVESERPCRTLGASWTDLSGIGDRGRVAIVTDGEGSRGPAVLYFGGPTDYAPGPDGWSPRVHTGFDLALFDTRTAGNADRLRAESREQRLDGHEVFQAPFVSRIIVRRTPLSPLELPIVLGPPRTAGVGRMRDDASGGAFAVCDAPAITVSRF